MQEGASVITAVTVLLNSESSSGVRPAGYTSQTGLNDASQESTTDCYALPQSSSPRVTGLQGYVDDIAAVFQPVIQPLRHVLQYRYAQTILLLLKWIVRRTAAVDGDLCCTA